jgi:predicted nucleotidyltransferase component of viral defense system
MIDKDSLSRHGPPGFHPHQKEKDYVQHHVLAYLSQSGFKGVFKGGTCLQKAYSLPRYSEDLDFSLAGAAEPSMESLSAYLVSTGFSGISWKREAIAPLSSIKLRLRGPLYNGTAISECSVLLEFGRKGATILPPVPMPITPGYPDLLPYAVRTMALDEMAAEKALAILSRESARDLFDLAFIMRRGIAGVPALASRISGKEFDLREFRTKARRLKKAWKSEIPALTASALSFAEAEKIILGRISQ